MILEKMRQIADGVSRMYGVDYKLNVVGGVPPVSNNADLIARAKGLVKDMDGLEIADQTDPICCLLYTSRRFRAASTARFCGFWPVLSWGSR